MRRSGGTVASSRTWAPFDRALCCSHSAALTGPTVPKRVEPNNGSFVPSTWVESTRLLDFESVHGAPTPNLERETERGEHSVRDGLVQFATAGNHAAALVANVERPALAGSENSRLKAAATRSEPKIDVERRLVVLK